MIGCIYCTQKRKKQQLKHFDWPRQEQRADLARHGGPWPPGLPAVAVRLCRGFSGARPAGRGCGQPHRVPRRPLRATHPTLRPHNQVQC